MKNEIQRGIQKGHRVVIKRDITDGKAIGYQVAEFLSVSDFEALQLEVEQKQKQLAKEKEQQLQKEKEKELLEKQKSEEKEKIRAIKEKYSIRNFTIAHNAIQHKILVGLVDDDGSFPLLLDRVLERELTVSEALELSDDLKKMFESIFGGEN